MTTSAELTAQVGVAVDEMKIAKDRFEAIREEVDKSALELSSFIGQLGQDVSGVIDDEMTSVVYVSLNGDDINSGASSSSPVLTIDKAFKLIPEGALGLIKLDLVKDEQDEPRMYPVDTWLDAGTKNIVICSSNGAGNGIKVFEGGSFTTRSGGSIKFGNPYEFSIYIDVGRSSDTLVYGYGGSAQFGGYYTVKLFNDSPTFQSIVKGSYHSGDSRVGASFCFADFCRLDTTGSTEHGFSLVDGYQSCFMILNTWTCVLDESTLLYSSNLKALQVPETGSYLLSI